MTPARTIATAAAGFTVALFGTFTDRPGLTLAGWLVIVGAALVAWSHARHEVTR